MIIVRTLHNNQITYTNIRHLINNMTIPDLEKYNIGLGAASSRTQKQKQKAQQYTNKIFNSIKTAFVTTDASIHKKNKKGGIGILAVDKLNKEIYENNWQIETEDAQYAEIYGIKKTLDLIEINK